MEKSSAGSVKQEINVFQSMFGMKGNKQKKDKNIDQSKTSSTGGGGGIESDRLPVFTLPSIPSYRKSVSGNENDSEDLLGLSRVLVWLMAPVAAEYLKYGKTIVSDPRRSLRLLSIIEKVQISEGGSMKNRVTSKDKSNENNDVIYKIPVIEEDKKVLLQWAFFEAASLIRQYGDLLEDVNSYLATGTSTVGECVILVEEELR